MNLELSGWQNIMEVNKHEIKLAIPDEIIIPSSFNKNTQQISKKTIINIWSISDEDIWSISDDDIWSVSGCIVHKAII